jgi:hypothetical protein
VALLDNIPGWKVFSTGIGIAALAVVGYFVYVWFIASPSDLKPLQEQAAEHALEQVAEKYASKVREQGPQNVVVMPVAGDTTNAQIRAMLISRLNRIEGVTADVPRSPTLEQRAGALVRGLIDKDDEKQDPQAVFEDAGEADEVLTARVEQNWSGADSGIVTLDVFRIVRDDTPERKARVLEPERIKGLSGTARPGDEPEESGPGFWSGLGKFVVGLLIVLAVVAVLPFLSWPLARAAFRADSNAANGALLVGLTALDLTALFTVGWLLAGTVFSTTTVVSAGLLLPLALVWNLRLLNFIEEQ